MDWTAITVGIVTGIEPIRFEVREDMPDLAFSPGGPRACCPDQKQAARQRQWSFGYPALTNGRLSLQVT